MPMITIDDSNYMQHVSVPYVGPDGKIRMTGGKPRNYNTHPVGSYGTMPAYANVTPMTDEEIQAAIIRKNADHSWLSDLREVGMYGARIPSRDQNGKGYCWMHSGVSADLLCRARDNQPYADLSAYAGACIIKGYRDEGGWGAEGVQWMQANGMPTSKTWPQQSMSRTNDTPAMRQEAQLYKPTGVWADLNPNDDRALATCLCKNFPVVVDFNWWSHSVCACRLISWKPLKILIWNSWGDSWSEQGMGELAGSKASADGQVALTEIRISQPV